MKTYLYDNYETVSGRQQKIYSFTEEGVEKFAELIINECADIAGEDWQTAGRAIREHFGVK